MQSFFPWLRGHFSLGYAVIFPLVTRVIYFLFVTQSSFSELCHHFPFGYAVVFFLIMPSSSSLLCRRLLIGYAVIYSWLCTFLLITPLVMPSSSFGYTTFLLVMCLVTLLVMLSFLLLVMPSSSFGYAASS